MEISPELPTWKGAERINAYVAETEALINAQWWALNHAAGGPIHFHFDAQFAGNAASGSWGYDPTHKMCVVQVVCLRVVTCFSVPAGSGCCVVVCKRRYVVARAVLSQPSRGFQLRFASCPSVPVGVGASEFCLSPCCALRNSSTYMDWFIEVFAFIDRYV